MKEGKKMFGKKEKNANETTQKKFYQKKLFWIIVIVLILAAAVGGNSDKDATSKTQNNEVKEETKISYQKYTANQLMKDLDENALNAQKKYKDQYVEVTGKLTNIDSSGDYIDIANTDNKIYVIPLIQCYIQDDQQLEAVSQFKKDDKIVVKGKVTDVGEIMGYSIDIDEVSKAK